MAAKVEVVHAASPLCSWSWGYQPVMNRLRLVYGDQIDLVTGIAVPYTSLEQWLKDYESTEQEAVDFENEIGDAIGVPMWRPKKWSELPESCIPGTFALKGAGIAHGADAERRLLRAILFATCVEHRDTSKEDVLNQIITSIGLDPKKVQKACAGDGPEKALEQDAHRLGHGANFYSLIVRKEEGTRVVLERAFEPGRVESAIDWLGGGKLKKKVPTDLVGYARDVGPVSLVEVQRVFALTEAKARAALEKAVKAGDLEQRTYKTAPGAVFWAAA